jgi:hypothetical protein
MNYPRGFPDRLRPRAEAAILKAQREFRNQSARERVKATIFAFAEVACSAAEAGEWKPETALAGIEQLLHSLCEDEWLSGQEPFMPVGTLMQMTIERFERETRQELRVSEQWIGYVQRLAALTTVGRTDDRSKIVRQDKRLSASVTSHVAASKVAQYLQSNGMGVSEFAIQAQTTDRTIRNFRKTGKVRRDILVNIARAMGTTRDELLKP